MVQLIVYVGRCDLLATLVGSAIVLCAVDLVLLVGELVSLRQRSGVAMMRCCCLPVALWSCCLVVVLRVLVGAYMCLDI